MFCLIKNTFSSRLQTLDGRIHEQVKDYLVSLCQTELETQQAAHNTFNQILSRSNGVSPKPRTEVLLLHDQVTEFTLFKQLYFNCNLYNSVAKVNAFFIDCFWLN